MIAKIICSKCRRFRRIDIDTKKHHSQLEYIASGECPAYHIENKLHVSPQGHDSWVEKIIVCSHCK